MILTPDSNVGVVIGGFGVIGVITVIDSMLLVFSIWLLALPRHEVKNMMIRKP